MTGGEIVALIVFGQFALIGAFFTWIHYMQERDEKKKRSAEAHAGDL